MGEKEQKIDLVMDNQSKRVPLGKTRSKKDCRFDFPLVCVYCRDEEVTQ